MTETNNLISKQEYVKTKKQDSFHMCPELSTLLKKTKQKIKIKIGDSEKVSLYFKYLIDLNTQKYNVFIARRINWCIL